MSLFKRVNKGYFLIFTSIVGILTFLSFIAAYAKDEGTIGENFIWNLFADLFNVFRFPTHNLLWDWMNPAFYIIGLVLNSMFYGLILERILNLIIKKRE